MIIPSIDIKNKNAVQLVGGRDLAVDAGDPGPVATRFSRVGELAVIDLDAARGGPSPNRGQILELVQRYPCRVGGGIRTVQTARDWLDAGAWKIILGTAARREILRELPKERVVAAIDAVHDEIVVQGWTQKSGARLLPTIAELREDVGTFLVTRVEKEGRMGGIDLQDACRLRDACWPAKLTLAGGVASAQEVAELDAEGIDAQVGMAIYSGKFSLGDAMGAMLKSDRPDGLWPTVVCDACGVALGLAYSSQRSLSASIESGDVHYESRKRGLWKKGASSGATQRLLSASLDCDRDTLRFVVDQKGPGFCHLSRRNCFDGEVFDLHTLSRRITERIKKASGQSYTKRLFEDQALLGSKILEEAGELVQAQSKAEVVHELADLLYFSLVRGLSKEVKLRDVERELELRARKVSRRPGNAKNQGRWGA